MNERTTTIPPRPHAHSACAPARKPKQRLNVLIACEESQAECIAFRELGHNAYSCDIQPCRKKGFPQFHIHGDVTPLLSGVSSFSTQDGSAHYLHHWDLIICHPPCTYLSKIGSLHMKEFATRKVYVNGRFHLVNEKRYKLMLEARDFFFKCLNAAAPYVAVENPIPMRLAQLPRADTFASPDWFGVKYTKKTLYWLKNLPPLMPTIFHQNPKCFVRSSNGKYRSRTFPQMAKAIATQWSDWILHDMK